MGYMITMGDRGFHGIYDYHGRQGFPWDIWLPWETGVSMGYMVTIGDRSFHERSDYHGR